MAMKLAARPWITAGVALVGACVVIVTPVARPCPGRPGDLASTLTTGLDGDLSTALTGLSPTSAHC
jgi:hypothetical protein